MKRENKHAFVTIRYVLWSVVVVTVNLTYNMPHFLLPLGPGIGFEGPPSSVGDGESLGRERARKTTRRRF